MSKTYQKWITNLGKSIPNTRYRSTIVQMRIPRSEIQSLRSHRGFTLIEIMVVIAPDAELEMTCGGAAMVDAGEAVTPSGEVHPDHAVGVAMGKRYIDEAETLEVLCVKSGDGSLAANGALLLQKDTKKLPKTD